jgi:hypothetical protein
MIPIPGGPAQVGSALRRQSLTIAEILHHNQRKLQRIWQRKSRRCVTFATDIARDVAVLALVVGGLKLVTGHRIAPQVRFLQLRQIDSTGGRTTHLRGQRPGSFSILPEAAGAGGFRQ